MTATVAGSCHCGAHRFTAPRPTQITDCNCSICSRTGSLVAYYAPGEARLETTPEALTAYQWGDRMMTFFHCAVCGCRVHATADAWVREDGKAMPARVTLNMRLAVDLDLSTIPVRRVDGRDR